MPNATLVELLRLLAPLDLEGDAFGKVYEYFLGNFALNVLFEEDDILFGTMRAHFRKVCVAPFAGVTRTTCGVLRARGPEHQRALLRQSNLRTTRDLLLPRLISGEFDVPSLPEPQPLAA